MSILSFETSISSMNFCLLAYSVNYKRSVEISSLEYRESGLKLRDNSLITDTVYPFGYSLLQAKERERFERKGGSQAHF